MNVMWDVQERTCAICGRVFIPKAPHQVLLGDVPARARPAPREEPVARHQAEARQGGPLSGRVGVGARRDHGHAARGRDEILSFRR